ncbi:MFS transporter [Candidatus Roizmanbacteria bacterium CG02_land_8_20_14_3_00_36_15]|uniref:MFS transporter n=2 Tax=Candidatus Roizmaniibacteriota TaxID=1752723 RepID=A0A2M8KKE2_9BACT|nr:MAG: MFS transporter [Candidatus Roizmanbacteria bacterium CG03_land_8_20_14_0_80_36_21]PIV38076.1 MAG: MFS transporter [Candidatus Roizmanbacteria bacterium CG02_land_8_20_14_3_00_36_15]PIY70081.1 MAG: MFS transporter [Candidatus Roizmanbacteria bacterium CG_4_10_14_0_8_um_filter_36_36]PJC82034.1 MAG: MFS transporter [Candidatus Roizmanbacteria bacterium CG_4_8_14_3_um_filter_36_10]PJE60396.1 MAG: MFS transporter [Candidatus Roizmanbacteria bacterium CG10_big_fil_rev_8_21_14_0_10_36_26]
MKKIPKNVLVLGLVSFFNDVASEMIYPIVPIFLTTVLGAPVFIVGMIEGIAEATASLGKFIFGYLSDKIHKRKIFVVVGYAASSISKLLIGLASVWPFVLFARFIDRFGKGLRTGARDSILLQNTTSKDKGFIFGFHRAFDSAGAFLGPILALILLTVFKENIRTIFFIAFIPAVIGVLLLTILIKEENEKAKIPVLNQSPGAPLSGVRRVKNTVSSFRMMDDRLIIFFIISIIFALGNSSDAFLILRAKNLGLTTTMTIFAYVLYNFFQSVFSMPAGSLADKIGARTVYAVGLLVFALVYFSFGIINHPLLIWILFPIYGIYIAATDGVSKAYISEFITEKESGTYFGLYQTGTAIASIIASFVAGILWTKVQPSAAFFYGAAMAMLAFLVLSYGKIFRKV